MTNSRRIIQFAAVCAVLMVCSAARADAQPSRSSLPLQSPPVARSSEAEPAPNAGEPGLGVVQTVGSLGLVVVLIAVLATATRWVARRNGGLAAQMGAGGRAPSGVAEILARYPVARGQTVVLMRIGPRVMAMFHATGGKQGPTMSPICEFSDPDEVADLLLKTREAEAEEAQAKFREAIEQADARHAAASREPAAAPSPFRHVQVSAEGDRAELLSVKPGGGATLPDRVGGLDAVARLRSRLSGLGDSGVTA